MGIICENGVYGNKAIWVYGYMRIWGVWDYLYIGILVYGNKGK